MRIDGSLPSFAIEEISHVPRKRPGALKAGTPPKEVRLSMSSQGNQLVRLFHVAPPDSLRDSRVDVSRFSFGRHRMHCVGPTANLWRPCGHVMMGAEHFRVTPALACDRRLKQLSPFGWGNCLKFRRDTWRRLNFGVAEIPAHAQSPSALSSSAAVYGEHQTTCECSHPSDRSGQSGAPRASALPMCAFGVSGKPERGCRAGQALD